MKKFTKSLHIMTMLGVGVVSAVWLGWSGLAQAQSPAPTASPATATISSMQQAGQVVRLGDEDGPHFIGGDAVIITEDLVGDVYVGGGSVLIESRIEGDLIVGGGNVTIGGEITDDLRVGGGSIVLNGVVGKNVTAGGGSITFGPSSEVAGSVIVGAGNLSFDGTVGGDLWAGAGLMRLNGEFGQGIQAEVGSLTVLPAASVARDLKVSYEEDANVSQAASVAGQVQIQQSERSKSFDRAGDAIAGVTKGIGTAATVATTLMALVSGLILLYLLPKFIDERSEQILTSPVPSLGWGLIALILLPILAVVLMAVVITLPLGFILLFSYFIMLMMANWITSKALGEKLYQSTDQSWLNNRYLQFIVGLLIIKVIGLVPVVGGIVLFGSMLLGLGSLLKWLRELI